ncbi:lytic polysaccharide monooxygenase [Xylariaceae sp. FL0594]|nr:lytic polysaccharide monooxygenase [Xylariaceae sp. FL0594]
MKFLLSTLALAITANAHTIFQKVTVNGADQGLLTGLRAPSNNNPVQDATSSSITCGAPGSTSGTVINVKAGDEIGAWYQHVIGGSQGGNDADNPIASSHKGPVTAYLAAVGNAASASAQSADWFKIFEDTLDVSSGRWGVDNLIANNGWVKFRLPTCIPSGDYLLRVETLALHSAYSQGGAQFYTSCAQLRLSGGGSTKPSSTVKFPGYYSNTGSDIMINIYGASGKPDNNGRPYTHGPSKFTC